MIPKTYSQKEIDILRCRSQHNKLARSFYLLLLLVVVHANLFAQGLNVTQAGLIEDGFGKVPNLTGASSVVVQGNYA